MQHLFSSFRLTGKSRRPDRPSARRNRSTSGLPRTFVRRLSSESLEDRLPLSVAPGFSLFPDGVGPQQSSEFGGAVALSEDYRVVASPRADVASYLDVGMISVYDSNNVLLQTIESPNPEHGDQFGFSLDIDGSMLVVGVPRDDVGASVNAGSIYVYDLAGATPDVPVLEIPNPANQPVDEFGHSVSIDGDVVVASAYLSNFSAADTGLAYVFDLSSAMPEVPIHTLANPDPDAGDRFGWSLDNDGDRIVVGAFLDDFGATDAGTAYVFDLTSALPDQPVHTIHNPIPEPSDQFAGDVSISGNLVAIGARVDDEGAENSGTVYVFDLAAANVGTPLHTIYNPAPGVSDQFGHAIDIDGNRIVIGAWLDKTNGIGTGNAFYFELDSATPTVPIHQFLDLDQQADGSFGYAVAVRGDAVVVGARTYDFSLGGAFAYDLAGSTPAIAIAALDNVAPASNDRFAYAVAASGDLVAVSVPLDDLGETNSGSVEIYDVSGAAPVLLQTLRAPAPAPSDLFGVSVAMDGTRVIVGAFREDTGAEDAGAAFVYDMASASPGIPVFELYNPAPNANDLFGQSVDISGDLVVVGAVVDDSSATDSGSAYVFDLSSATPTQSILSLSDPLANPADIFGWQVAISGTKVLAGAPNNDTDGTNSGRVYVFDITSATPDVPIHFLDSPNPSPSGQIGYALAIDGNTAVVGEILGDNGNGAAYVYDLASATPNVAVQILDRPTPAVNDVFGISVDVNGSLVAVGAALDDHASPDAGRAFLYDLAGAEPTQPFMALESETPDAGDQFGFSVAIGDHFALVGASLDDTLNVDQGAAYLFSHINSAPQISAQTFSVDENDQGSVSFATVLATDSESDVGFSITGGTGAGKFSIEPETGELKVVGTLNFEDTPSYTLDISASDVRGEASFATITINVNDVNEAPVASDDQFAVDEDSVFTLSTASVLDNDSDEDVADILGTVVTVTNFDVVSALGAVVSVAADGTLTYDATAVDSIQALGPGESTDDSFTYTITDSGGLTSTGVVTVTIDGANDLPVSADDVGATNEDSAISGNVLTNDLDVDAMDIPGSTVLVTAFDAISALGATVTVQPNGTFSYDPTSAAGIQQLNPGEPAVDTFTYEISDSQSASSSATVTIDLIGLNDAPVAVDDDDSTSEDALLSGSVLDNDEDLDAQDIPGTTLRVTSFDSTSALGVSVNVAPDGSYAYDPSTLSSLQELDVGDEITDSFTYTVTDSAGIMATATVTVTIMGSNDAPVASDDQGSTSEDATLNGDLFINDADVDADDMLGTTVSVTSFDAISALGAAVQVQPDGTYSYDPAPSAILQALNVGVTIDDTFTYTITDPLGLESTATVTVTVGGANDAPVASSPNLASTSLGSPISEDVMTTVVVGTDIPLSDFATDLDDVLSFSALTLATVTITIDGVPTDHPLASDVGISYDAATGALAVDPADVPEFQGLGPGQLADVTAQFTMTDSGGLSDTAAFMFQVIGANDAPNLTDDSGLTDELTVLASLFVLDNDSDIDGDSILLTELNGTSVVAGDSLALASGAIVTVNSDSSLSYDPNGSFPGITENVTETFTYTATDGTIASTATVTVTVTPENRNPIANDDTSSTNEDAVLDIAAPELLANDTDPDSYDVIGDTVLVSAHDGTSALGAVVVVNPDGSYSYDPTISAAIQALDEGDTTIDTFTYTIADYFGALGSGTVSVSLLGVNDAPTAADDEVTASADSVLTGALLANDVDVDEDDVPGVNVTVTSFDLTSTLGALINVQSDGTFSYDATLVGAALELDLGDVLTDTFSYTISDNAGLESTATVTVTLHGANDAPTPGNDTLAAGEDGIFSGSVIANDVDVDVEDVPGVNVLVSSFDSTSALGATVFIEPDGSFTYDASDSIAIQQLDAGAVLADTFTYTLTDALGASGMATVTIELTGANDEPVLINDWHTTSEDSPLSINVLDNDTDVDQSDVMGTTVTVTSFDATSALGLAISIAPDGSFTYDPTTDAGLQSLDAGDIATDYFNYTVTDSGGATRIATVVIYTFGSNDAPMAASDNFAIDEDSSFADNVLTNDEDTDSGDSVGATVTVTDYDRTSALGVPIAISADGSFLYDPANSPSVQALDADDLVADSFSYTITDSQGVSSSTTVTVDLTGVNDSPVAMPDDIVTDGDSALSGNTLDNDLDPDANDVLGTLVTVTSFDATTALGVALSMSADGSYSYDPTLLPAVQMLGAGETITDSFTYSVTDSQGVTDTSTVTILISGVNDDPFAAADHVITDEDTVLQRADLLSNDSDPDEGDSVGVNVTVSGFDSLSALGAAVHVQPDGSYTYDPTASPLIQSLDFGDTVDDTFTYTIVDALGASSTATVTISITGSNDGPVATDDSVAAEEDLVVSLNVLTNDDDIDGDDEMGTSVTVSTFDATSVLGATVTMNADGSVVYDPTGATLIQELDAIDVATDSFTYTIADSQGETSTATVFLHLAGSNDAPVAGADVASADENSPLNAPSVFVNDTDADGDDVFGSTVVISAFDTTSALGAAVTVNADGSYVYDPTGAVTIRALAAGQTIEDTFSYTITDGYQASSTGTVTVTVRGVRSQFPTDLGEAKVTPATDFDFPPSQGNPAQLTEEPVDEEPVDEVFAPIGRGDSLTSLLYAIDVGRERPRSVTADELSTAEERNSEARFFWIDAATAP